MPTTIRPHHGPEQEPRRTPANVVGAPDATKPRRDEGPAEAGPSVETRGCQSDGVATGSSAAATSSTTMSVDEKTITPSRASTRIA